MTQPDPVYNGVIDQIDNADTLIELSEVQRNVFVYLTVTSLNLEEATFLIRKVADRAIELVTNSYVCIRGCRGCAENQPNQMAHVGEGGCLRNSM